jgi:hypothetical protein
MPHSMAVAIRPEATVQTGDVIETGPKSRLVFVIGNSSFHVRQNSRLAVERGQTLNAVSLLRLLTGAVVSVWGRGASRRIVTPTLTAGIRGTGVYTEVFADKDFRSYVCNCYGTVDVSTASDKVTSVSEYHQAFWADRRGTDDVVLVARQGHQPHGRRVGVSGQTGGTTHGMANQRQKRFQRQRHLLTHQGL